MSEPIGSQDVPPLSMGDPRWAELNVGSSAEKTKNIGCMVTAAIAAANALKGSNLGVDVGMARILAAGGFSGALLILPTAMSALGCVQKDKDRLRNSRNIPQLKALIDDTLAKGGIAMVHVDYDLATPMSNHFVDIFTRDSQGKYGAMDPAGGKYIVFDSNLRCKRTETRTYDVTGVAPIFAA